MMGNATHEPRAVFTAALALTVPAERGRYLDAACQGKPELRQRVEALLHAHAEAGDFLQANGPDPLDDFPAEGPGTLIGRYKLLEEIGEGAFGQVFMAEQTEPVHRKVALKIIKAGMDTREVIARFEAERQALALMDHPNIAKILDAGVTREAAYQPSTLNPQLLHGRPYFVMELVRGVPITTYCDQQQLPTAERLRLFMKVCAAVQHAHQKGIIHRDLKPTNILVTEIDGQPVPKVIDFGVAKALGQKLTEKTLFTAFQQMIGTPAYMSPEQAALSGVDVDTRSDIYSLGVLLYELLTGVTPFDADTLHKVGLDEIRRLIRETEPPKPSTRLQVLVAADVRRLKSSDPQPSTRNSQPASEASSRRLLQIKEAIRLLRGDLDWIVMKCLEKERARRYDTASALAEDLQHHLDHQPVVASPPSALYRARKFIRRHRVGVAMATALTLALAAGLTAALIGFQQARHERDRAELLAREEKLQRQRAEAGEKRAQEEASRSQQVARLLKGMLEGVGPDVALGRDTTLLRAVLDKAARRIGKDLKDQPAIEAELRATIGQVYCGLGDYQKAEATLRVALAIRQRLLGKEHPDVASSCGDLGKVIWRQGKLAEAEALLREALTLQQKLLGKEDPDVVLSLDGLAAVLRDQGKLAEAEATFREALAMKQRVLGKKHPDVADSLNNLGVVLMDQGNLAQAEALLREALTMKQKVLGKEHPNVAVSLNTLGAVLCREGKLAEAETMHREALAMEQRLLGKEHPEVALKLNNVAAVLSQRGKLAEAEALCREALAMMRKLLGEEHPNVAHALGNLASVLKKRGKLAEAEALFREALTMRQKLLGKEHPDVAGSLNDVAGMLEAQGKLGGAEALFREALTMQQKLLGKEHPAVALLLNNLTVVLRDQGKLVEAETLCRQALTMKQRLLGKEHPDVADSLNNLAVVLADQGKLAEAEALYREALTMQQKLLGQEHPDVASSLANLGNVLMDQGKLDEAETSCRQALAMFRKLLGNEHPRVAHTLNCLAEVSFNQGKLAEAVTLFREAAELGNAHAVNQLAWLLATCHDPQVRDGRSAVAFAEKAVAGSRRQDPVVLDTLAAAYAEVGQFTNAVKVQKEAIALLKNDEEKTNYGFRLKLFESNTPYLDHVSLARSTTRLLEQQNFAAAELLARECLAIREREIPEDWRTFTTRSLLGASLQGQKKYAEAEPLLLSGYEGLKQREDKLPAAGRARLKETLQRLVQLYEAMGRANQASEWKRKLAEFEQAKAEKHSAAPPR